MLTNTFSHIPSVGPRTEERLWQAGITTWDNLAEFLPIGLSTRRSVALQRHLDESRQHAENSNPHYFTDLLPSSLHWRVFPEFRHSTAYLDIETTGVAPSFNEITTITLYNGTSIFHYIQDQNLEDFLDDIEKYSIIVTFNGKCFDVPFIRTSLGAAMTHVNIDLRYVLGSLGYTGGLKACETQLGIDRGELKGLDGYDAVLLWNEYRRSTNERVLETLLAYNTHDVVNLECLMVMAYNLKLKETPFFETHQVPTPILPDIAVRAYPEVIDMIKDYKRRGGIGTSY